MTILKVHDNMNYIYNQQMLSELATLVIKQKGFSFHVH